VLLFEVFLFAHGIVRDPALRRTVARPEVVAWSVTVLDGGPEIVYSYAWLLVLAKLKSLTSSSVIVVVAPPSVAEKLSAVQVTYE
jgi:hypothetical protein